MLDERVFTQYAPAHEATTTNTPDDEAQQLADIASVDELAAIKQAAQVLTIKQQNAGYSLDPQHGGAVHVYDDADGAILYARIRLKHANGDKHIRPIKRNERGAWVMGEPPKPEAGKPLYNLHALHARNNESVMIVEGEYCADRLMELGILATTSGGASSDDVTDWQPLAGRDVIIWADNDEAGAGYQDRVTARLYALGCAVQHIDIAQLDLPPKGDVVDWLKAFADTRKRKAAAADVWGLPCIDAPQDTIQADSSDLIDAGDTNTSWQEPQPLIAKSEPFHYPLDALPIRIKNAVIEVRDFVQAPVALVATAALSAVSLAVQAHVDVQRAEGLTSPCGIFALTVAESGERKSSSEAYFMRAIRDYEKARCEAAKAILKEHDAQIVIWESMLGGLKDRLRQDKKTNKSTSITEREISQHYDSKPIAPRVPRLVYDDVTPEQLGFKLAKEWPTGGLMSAEGGTVLGSHGMGKDNALKNFALLNTLWDGGTKSTDRRTTDSFTVENARLTMSLQVQESALREFFNKTGTLARGTGFLARFLFAWPVSTQGTRPFKEPPANWPHLAAFNNRIAAILLKDVPITESGGLAPLMLTMTPDARVIWIAFFNDVEQELAPNGALADVRDVASKIADNAARLAALFHYFEGGDGQITAESVSSANAIAQWHLSESLRFFNELSTPLHVTDAVKLDGWLIDYCKQNAVNQVAKNHTLQHGSVRAVDRMDAALNHLAGLNRLMIDKHDNKTYIVINPKLLGA
jgi:5S rRNA maturation endonuclease (ribonuclease M5)